MSNYETSSSLITVKCNIHGSEHQVYANKLISNKHRWTCPDCKIEETVNEFISKSKEIFGEDTYDYSELGFTGMENNIRLKCNKHNEWFEVKANKHLKLKRGCPICKKENHIPLSAKTFVLLAERMHGKGKYDYSKFVYKNSETPVKIKCLTCGNVFMQTPESHIYFAKGCHACGDTRKTNEQYIKEAREKHGDKFNYDKLNYINNHTNITVFCNEHQIEFETNPSNHLKSLNGGCPKCKEEYVINNVRIQPEEIKNIITSKFPDFNYDKTVWKTMNDDITITCPIHGDFVTKPLYLLKYTYGCPKCADTTHDTEWFISESKNKYGDRFTYEKTEYVNLKTKVIVTCRKHGDFKVTPSVHLSNFYGGCSGCHSESFGFDVLVEKIKQKHGDNYEDKFIIKEEDFNGTQSPMKIYCRKHGEVTVCEARNLYISDYGCPKCGAHIPTQEEFIQQCREVHGDYYDLSEVVFVNMFTDIKVICREHGPFYTRACWFVYSANGCPKCNRSHGEIKVYNILKEMNIEHEEQKTFEWLKYNRSQFIDFYIESLNVAIEVQGLQHFKPIHFFYDDIEEINENFEYIISRDKNKHKLCIENNINVIYVAEKSVINQINKIDDLSHIDYDVHCIDDLKEILENLIKEKSETDKLL